MNYIVHHCKDKTCNNGWIDEDLYNSAKPPAWKYCPSRVSKGRTNPKKKPIDPEFAERMKILNLKSQEKRARSAVRSSGGVQKTTLDISV